MTQSYSEVLKSKYAGSVAANYERARTSKPSWRREQDAVKSFLARAGLGPKSVVLDIPVGTGRFLPFYGETGAAVIGQDISADMLEESRRRCTEENIPNVSLEVGDITSIKLPDGAADVVVCVRFMQHVDFQTFRTVMDELARVSRRHVIVGVHMFSQEKPGVGRLLSSLVATPRHTLRRIVKRLQRMKAPRPPAGSAMPSHNDKPEPRVREEFAKRGLSVVDERLIDSSLDPRTAIRYRLFLLEKDAGR